MLRSEDPELYLEKAVHRLCDYYGKALTLEYVRNKIAWALYQTWKEFDKKSEERRMKCLYKCPYSHEEVTCDTNCRYYRKFGHYTICDRTMAEKDCEKSEHIAERREE